MRLVGRLCHDRHATATGDNAAGPRQRVQLIERLPRQQRGYLEGGEGPGEFENLMVREDEEADAMRNGAI
jgi:hypothetical protein